MFTRNYINFQSHSPSVETCDSNSPNEEFTKPGQDYTSNYSYPCRWDQLPSNKHIFTNHNFPSKLTCKSLQPEYWWSRYSSDLKDKSLKNHWLSYIGQRDDRYNLTEYQLIREIIWVLLGARGCFAMQLCKNQIVDICCKSHLTSVSHLSYDALDSLLRKFVDWNNHILFIRLVVHFVVNKMDCISHACVFSFASCLNGFLSQLDEFLHEMESKSRNPGIFTMISLYHCLIPWCNRVKILSKIIKDIVENNLDNLRQTSTTSTLLDALRHTSDLLEDCGFDQYIVQVLRSMFIITFHPFISSLVQLFSGSATFNDPLVKLFADINYNIPPGDPKFWSDAIKPRNKVLDSSCIPYMFLPIMDEVVDGLKANFLLIAVCEEIGDYSFLETVDAGPVCISLDSLLSEQYFRSKLSHQESYLSKNCYKGDGSRTTLKSLESQLKRFVCERRMLINQQLLKLLLHSHMRGPNGLRTVGNCLAVAGAVYLFGAGYNMDDFARQCFGNISFPRAKKLDLVDLTANLQSQLSDTFRNRHASHSLLHLESTFLAFDFLSVDQLIDDRPMELIFDLIGNLKLNYHLDWPANIILDEKSIGIYNDVFIFLLQIKYVKWSLENLHFSTLEKTVSTCFSTNHHLIILRIKMLFIFTNLHDFLAHRIEAIRTRFSSKWCLPEFYSTTSIDHNIPETYTFANLVQDHKNLLNELQSVCLLTESTSLLFTEIYNLCNMGLQLRELWSKDLSSPNCETSRFKVKIEFLSEQFDNHVQFLSTMLTRSVRLSTAKQLLYLSSSFKVAASFPTNIFKSIPSK